MELNDVEKLAELARIDIPSGEKKELLEDLQSILEYVDQIQAAPVKEEAIELMLKNVFREDNPPAGGPHEPEAYTEKLMKEAPKAQDGYIKVKKIL